MDVSETTGTQAISLAAKEANAGGGGGDKSQVNTPQAGGGVRQVRRFARGVVLRRGN